MADKIKQQNSIKAFSKVPLILFALFLVFYRHAQDFKKGEGYL